MNAVLLELETIKTKNGTCKIFPIIVKYTNRIEYLEKLPSKKNYVDVRECAMAGLQYGKAKFGNNLINMRVLKEGKVVESWQQ